MEIATAGEGFLEALYRQYHSMLCSYIRRSFGPGPPEPEDVAQAAFARFAALDDQRDVPNPKAFLMLTARNLVIDAHRKMARGQAAFKSLGVLTESHHAGDASSLLISREELQRLAIVVDGLKPKQRVAFLMHRIDGLSFAEIARRMRISESGARLLVDTALAICVAKARS